MIFFEPTYYLRIFLVFVRVGGLMVSAPFFGHQSVPVRVKILLSVLLSYALVGMVPGPLPEDVDQPVGFMLAVAIEALTGVMLGYGAQFIFYAVQVAGEIMGFQMGLGLAKVFNPIDGMSSNPLGRFLTLSMLLVFLLLDGHHHVLRALMGSFEVVPLAGANLGAAGPLLLEWTGAFFTTALRLASPFMITIFLIDLSLGIFARVAPQANLFMISLPVKQLVGLSLAVVFMQHFFPVIPDFVHQMLRDMLDMIGVMAP